MENKKTSTGSYELNKFLFGGYERDIITTIYGPGGSGKSNIAMIAATSRAKKNEKVIFIDTEGSFSTDRFKQIHRGDKVDVEKDLQNILLLSPTNFKEQEDSFKELRNLVKKGGIKLIIVDSIAMLYRLELAEAINSNSEEEIKKVNRKLANELKILNEISRKEAVPVVVTNQVYTTFNEEERKVSMVGGDLLKYWSKCIIEVENKGGRRKLILRKHRSLPEKELPFEIVNSGIKRRTSLF